jgi:hypothetical protein
MEGLEFRKRQLSSSEKPAKSDEDGGEAGLLNSWTVWKEAGEL